MAGGESGRGLVAKRRMWPSFVVVAPPIGDQLPRVVEIPEPMVVQAFVPESPIERVDVGVLCGLARLNQLQFYTPLMGPLVHGLAGELRALVGTYRARQTAKATHLVQNPRDAASRRNPTIFCSVNRFFMSAHPFHGGLF